MPLVEESSAVSGSPDLRRLHLTFLTIASACIAPFLLFGGLIAALSTAPSGGAGSGGALFAPLLALGGWMGLASLALGAIPSAWLIAWYYEGIVIPRLSVRHAMIVTTIALVVTLGLAMVPSDWIPESGMLIMLRLGLVYGPLASALIWLVIFDHRCRTQLGRRRRALAAVVGAVIAVIVATVVGSVVHRHMPSYTFYIPGTDVSNQVQEARLAKYLATKGPLGTLIHLRHNALFEAPARSSSAESDGTCAPAGVTPTPPSCSYIFTTTKGTKVYYSRRAEYKTYYFVLGQTFIAYEMNSLYDGDLDAKRFIEGLVPARTPSGGPIFIPIKPLFMYDDGENFGPQLVPTAAAPEITFERYTLVHFTSDAQRTAKYSNDKDHYYQAGQALVAAQSVVITETLASNFKPYCFRTDKCPKEFDSLLGLVYSSRSSYSTGNPSTYAVVHNNTEIKVEFDQPTPPAIARAVFNDFNLDK